MQGTDLYPETQLFVDRMTAAAISKQAVEAFCRLYRRFRQGDPGKLAWEDIAAPGPDDLVPFERLRDEELDRRGRGLLDQLVVISVNGGLGTTMKLQQAKSLIPVREGLSFLELTAAQIQHLRRSHGVQVPWLLMNSYRTQRDTLTALKHHGLELEGLPLDFLQNRFPRIERCTGLPLQHGEQEERWAPPGHGDIYLALWQTGLLQQLVQRGYRWAFVSNIDNLGATVAPEILGFLDATGAQFAMEVTERSPADVKGGTLVRFRGRLMLLERSQVAQEHLDEFQQISVFSVFNTNNLWWRLDAMAERLERGLLDLPMIVNPKSVGGVEVVQLETAMGAALGSFDHSIGICVPRTRFAPVKASCDLLVLRSDLYLLDAAGQVCPNPARDPAMGPPVVVLDERHYQGLEDFERRVPHPLSLVSLRSLTVEGDLRFGKNVHLQGDVVLRNPTSGPVQVPDGAIFADGSFELR